MKMCEEFARQGIRVELVVPDKKNFIGVDPFEYYGLERNFSVRYLPTVDFLSKEGATGQLFFWIDYTLFLLAILISGCCRQADIIYTRDYILLSLFAGKNAVLEIHDIPRAKKIFFAVVKKVKKILVITNGLEDELVKMGVDKDKIFVVPDAVDLDKFNINVTQAEARQKLSLPPDKKIILYVGHLYGWKGADVLAEAAEFLKNYLVLFVGGVAAELSEFQDEYRDSTNIKIIPFQKRELMPFYLKSADVLALPNKRGDVISEKYTSPLKMFEYMASGRPIIASDLSSIREVLNQNNSILVEPNNPENLARGIKKVLESSELADKITRQALADVQNFTWQKRAEKIIDFTDFKKE
jgi:glycosyltransferase involved in cell wall biosynthesis